MTSNTASHILSRIKSSDDAGEVLSSISEHLRPFLNLLTCREDERARANRSISKRFLPFIKKSISLLHKRLSLSLITSPESSPGDLFRAYDFCLDCYEMVSRHPTTVQARRLELIHSYQNWGWYTHAYNDGFKVLEQFDQPEPISISVLFLPLAKPGFGQGNLGRVLLKVIASIVSSVTMSRDMEENQYLRICSLLREIKPWLRYLDGNAEEKFLKLILFDMEKSALSIVRESVRFHEGFVHSFCISTLKEYSVSSLPKCHLYKFSRQVLSLLFLSEEIKIETVACEIKVEAEENWLDLIALVSYCAHKSLLAGDRISKQLDDIAAVFLEAIPQANVILRLYSAGMSVSKFNVKLRKNGKETKEPLGLEGLLGDDDLWKSIVSLLGMIDHYPDDNTTLSDVKKIDTQVQNIVNCNHKGAMEYTTPFLDALRFLCQPLASLINFENKKMVPETEFACYIGRLSVIQDMFLQFYNGLGFLQRWTYNKKCNGTDFDKTLLNIAMAAFLISMGTERKLEACVTKEQKNLISEPSIRLTRSMSRSLKERGHMIYVDDMHIAKKRRFSDGSDSVDIFDTKDTVCNICNCINKKCQQCLSNNEATRPGLLKSLISSKWQFQQRRLVCNVLNSLGARDACTMQFLSVAAPVLWCPDCYHKDEEKDLEANILSGC